MYQLDPRTPNNNGFINEDLIVWMREAAFPRFKKLYGVLNRLVDPFIGGLPVGNYSIDISYSILQPCRTSERPHGRPRVACLRFLFESSCFRSVS